MPYTPQQVSFTSTFSPERLSEYANFVNRIISGNKNIIIYPSKSFLILADNTSPTIIVGPGLAIIRNMFVHILEDTTINVTDNNCYFSGDTIDYCPNKYYNLFLYFDENDTSSVDKFKYVIVKEPTPEFINMIENNNGLWLASFVVDIECDRGHFITEDTINIVYSSEIVAVKSKHGIDKIYTFTREDTVVVRYPILDQVNGGAVFYNSSGKIIWRDDFPNSSSGGY